MANCCPTCGQTVRSKPAYGLTPRLSELYDFIVSYIAANKASPSYDDMALALGLASKSGVVRMVNALEERGLIDRIPFKKRTVVLAA